jgi:hypothetical protein
MTHRRLDTTFTRPTPSSEDCNKSMTLWPAKEPAPPQPSEPPSGSQPSQGGSQGGSGSQESSQSGKK